MTRSRHHLIALLASVTPLIAVAQRPAATVPVWTGKPDFVLGKEDDEHESFRFVSGMAVVRDGRLVVADWKEHRVRVFSPGGKYQFDIGREGGGPGEFRQPCCMRVLDDGTLLVGDPQARRFNRYRVEASRAFSIGTVVTRGGVMLNPSAPAPSRLGANRYARLLSIMGDCRSEYEVQQMDSLGTPVSSFKVAAPPADSLDLYVKRKQQRDGGRSCDSYPMIYGSQYLLAFSPAGDFARVISGRYDIEWRTADGKLRTRIARAPEPPIPFTADERQMVSLSLDLIRKEYPGPRRVVAPAGRAPISSLLFDELNRLWVVRDTPETSPGAADIYDAFGHQVARATWPAGYALRDRDLATASALFILTSDTSDVTHVTRIRFR